MWIALLSAVLVLAAKGWAEEGFTFLKKGPLSVSGDYLGVALGDAGADEDYLYFIRGEGPGRLLRWSGKAAREIRLPEIEGTPGSEVGTAWVDYDGDGDLDLLINRYRQRKLLFRNDGGDLFAEVGVEVSLDEEGPGQGVAWADCDQDGDLDLYAVNFGAPNQLYRNDGDHFTEVGSTLGVDDDGQGISAAWADYDADGDLDLYLVNYGQVNRLYESQGAGRKFTEVASERGVADKGQGIGCAWVDYDADGDWDLSLARYEEAGRLYRNDGKGRFGDVAASLGLDDKGQGQQAAWGDYDRDGNLDLFMVNGGDERADISRLYRNGGARFEDVTSAMGLVEARDAAKLGKGAVWWDMDRDGDLDLYVVNKRQESGVYRNDEAGKGNRWLSVRVESPAEQNKFGMGAEVRLWSGGRVQVRQVGLSSNYLSQGSQRAYFGLGEEKVDSCKIYWPDGVHLPLAVATNQVVEVKRRPAELVLEPNEIDFGSKPVRKRVIKTFSIKNAGEAQLVITGLSIDPVEYANKKVITTTDKKTPWGLAPGQRVVVQVGMTPQRAVNYHGRIILQSNVGVEEINLRVSGTLEGGWNK